jgi:hypothetical protein
MLIITLTSIMILLYTSYLLPEKNALAVLSNHHTALSTKNLTFTKQSSFIDSHGMLNIVGVVDNIGTTPARVRVGLNVTQKDTSEPGIKSSIHSMLTMTQSLYGRVIFPLGGAPFKFVIDPNRYDVHSVAFLANQSWQPIPNYDSMLRLNYSNMASRPDGLLMGTAKNLGQFDLRDVSVYASAHDSTGKQIDSVKSNPISIIRPGEEVKFTATPDPTEKSKVFFYSCAGVDLNEPINTLSVGNGKFIAYDLQSIAKVSDFNYDNNTDSIKFGIEHYNPAGGPATFRLAQLSEHHTVFVTMDGKPYPSVYDSKTTITRDGKTIRLNLFIPKGEHEFVIRGVSDKGKI